MRVHAEGLRDVVGPQNLIGRSLADDRILINIVTSSQSEFDEDEYLACIEDIDLKNNTSVMNTE